jgi:pimeloyl-ACP methyl ester carboxylesterase
MLAVGDTQLAILEQGEGEPILFVHGALGDYRFWREVATALSEDYHTVTYSRRAHFPNPWPENYDACDAEVHAADMAALIEALELGPVHLVAHSIGGVAALLMATRRPELVRSLVLGEPPLLPWLGGTSEGDDLLTAHAASATEPAQAAFRQGDQEEGVRRFLNGVIGAGAFDRIPPAVRGPLLDNAPELGIQVATSPEMLFSSLRPDDLRQLQVPVLFLRGERSPRMFGLIIAALRAALPQTEVAQIPGVSHDLSNPPVIVEVIRAFLQHQGAAS